MVQRTERTIVANLRMALRCGANGAKKWVYPEPYSGGVMVDVSETEQRQEMQRATDHFAQWKESNPDRAMAWADACAEMGKVLCPESWFFGGRAELNPWPGGNW